jgi:hypothetical protein
MEKNNMNEKKKSRLIVAVACVITVLAMVASVRAGDVFGNAKVTIGINGTSTYTNLNSSASVVIQRLWVHYDLATIDTVTVTRVTSTTYDADSNAYTNTIGTVVTAAGSGNVNLSTNLYWGLRYGDKLVFQTTTGTANTGAVVVVEYRQQEH